MTNKRTRLVSLLLALMMATMLILTGCTKDAGGNGSNGNGTVKDSLTVATMSETPSMSPYDHNAVAGDYMNKLTFSSLFETDAEMNPVPNLVEDYETLSDTEWQFTLKKGIMFQNGTEMKAEDVKASIEYGKTFAEVSLYNNSVASIEVVDDYTFKIVTPTPSATLLYDLCHHGNAIVPKALIDEGNDFNANPVGSGPFKLVEWKRGDSIEFEAFEEYFEGAPAIKKMTWKIVPEGSSRTIALEAGEVDMVIEVEAMDAERIESNPDLTLLKHESTALNWLILNNEKPGLDNVNVRRAINSAINRDDLITVAVNGLATPAYSAGLMGVLGATDEGTDTYDMAKAQKYISESGVDPASITLSIICSNDMKKRAAEVIQSNLAQIGINCQIESMDLATYLSTTAEGNFTGSIGGYSSSDMVSYLVGVYHSASIGASNKTRLNNPEIDALIEKASSTVDSAEREVVLKECVKKLNEICAQVSLWQDLYLRGFNANLQGVEINAAGNIQFENISWKA